MKNNKTKNLRKIYLLHLLILFLVAFVSIRVVFADNDDSENGDNEQVSEQIEEQEEELKELESKIKTYEKLIDQKRSQKQTLNNQISIIEGEISKNQEQIKKSNKEMELIKLQVRDIEKTIEERNEDIEEKQKILGVLINNIHHQKKKKPIELLLKYDNLGQYFKELERLYALNSKTKDVLDDINRDKLELEKEKKDMDEKYEKLMGLKQESEKSKKYLESQQDAKEDILTVTQGEENKYQDMLKKVEAQRDMLLGNIEELTNEKSGEMAAVKAKQKKPKSGLASTKWYYSQRDPRWAKDNIGMSTTKMDQYGCAVTSVSMVLRYHGIMIDPGVLAKQKIFYYDLIVWPSYWQGVKRVSSSSHGNIDWDVIDEEIEDGNPVIVFIGAKGKGAGHYVVIHGKDKKGEYVVHDPYWGSNIYLDSTRDYISVLYGAGTYIDQMIIYHGEGDSYVDVNDDEMEERTEEIKDCVESGGEWEEDDEECDCPKKYDLEDGKCEKD